MSSNWTCSNPFWTREEDKAFENALAMYSDVSNPWEKIAAEVPGKTVEEIKDHFEVLVADVNGIESGLVPLPHYADSCKKSTKRTVRASVDRNGKRSWKNRSESSCRERSSQSDGDRRRGRPWSEEEHRLFLQGLDKYGRGDWRSISRLCVRSRTPSQVASHAQKFFKHMDIGVKESTRVRIHDVTILDDGKIVTQQVSTAEQIAGAAGSCFVETGLYPSSNTVGINLCSSLVDNQFNISTPQGPLTEEMIGAADFDWLDCLIDNLGDISTPQGPTGQQITEAAGVGLCTPLIASHHISTPQEPIAEQIASAGVDFCDSPIVVQDDIATPQGSMSGQMIGTAEGAQILNFEESSSLGWLDCLIDSLDDVSTPQGPTGQQITEAAGVSLCTPLIASQHISTPQEPIAEQIASAGVDFCDSPIIVQDDVATPQGSMSGQMIGTAEGAHKLKFEESSSHCWLDCLIDNLDDISTPQGPTGQQITEAAGVSLCTPLIASQHNISTPQEPIAEQIESADFCDSPFIVQDDAATPQGSMSGQMIGTAEEVQVLNFEESSSRGRPDFGVHASPTASQPVVEPVPSDVSMLGFFPSPLSPMYGLDSPDFEAFLAYSPDDITTLTYQMPPSDQN